MPISTPFNITVSDIDILPGDYWQLNFHFDDAIKNSNALSVYLEHQWKTLPFLSLDNTKKSGTFLFDASSKEKIPFWETQKNFQATALSIGPTPEDDGAQPVIVGKNRGIGPALFLAKQLRRRSPMVFLESDAAFPFQPVPSKFLIRALPTEVIAAAPLLENLNIPSRLIAPNLPGCYSGDIETLISRYKTSQPTEEKRLAIIWILPKINSMYETSLIFEE